MVSCDICGCTIRLRYQVSDILCPIKFKCPECSTEINGSVQTIWHDDKEQIKILPWHYDLKLNNASAKDIKKCKYVLELSPDLSTNKIAVDSFDINNMSSYIPTPFIRQASDSDGIVQQNTRFYNFIEKWETEWEKLKIDIDLCYNEKYEILLPRLQKKYNAFPDDINCIMSVHQKLILFSNKILPKGILKEYTKIGKQLNKIIGRSPKAFDDFMMLYDYEYTKQIERKTLYLIKEFLDMYPKFLPVFNSLKCDEYKELGVSTLTFEDIKSFYQDAYELILYDLARIIALNNISCRKDMNKFYNDTADFEEKINSYNSRVKVYENAFSKKDEFSWLISNSIENHIRNSIGHFNYEENITEQTIKFIDDYKGKKNVNIKTLMEIARDCVYMFYTLMNLLELNYNLLKMQTIMKIQNDGDDVE